MFGKQGRGSRTGWAAGGWLCPLLDEARPAASFLLVDIQDLPDGETAVRKQFQPNKRFQAYCLALKDSCKFSSKI